MKKSLILIILGIVFLFGLLMFVLINKEPDFIKLAMASEKRLVAVYFVQNPNVLKEIGIAPPSIKTKKDLEDYLSPYWDQDTISAIWKRGTSIGLPFGFYSEMSYGLLEAENIHIKEKEANRVVVTGLVKWMDGDYKRDLVLIKTKAGWRGREENLL